MKEIVIISGKGGTGKTSFTASFASLSSPVVIADCDVDAPDLHLLLDPVVQKTSEFISQKTARIKPGHCTACGKCEELCRFEAISFNGPGNGRTEKTFIVDPFGCEGCGVCTWFCDYNAIDFCETLRGRWFISETRMGPLIYAKMLPGAENSGKLVSILREQAKNISESRHLDTILVDGSPGVGCPVISSVTGADLAVIVTEPTLSGLHDLLRVGQLTRHFGIPSVGIINKWDLNPEITEKIQFEMMSEQIGFAGKISYDSLVTKAQMNRKAVVELTNSGIALELSKIWNDILKKLHR